MGIIETVKEYYDKGFKVITATGEYKNGKKVVNMPIGYNNINTIEDFNIQPKSHNFLIMRMGIEFQPNKYIILFDIDNKETESVKNGFKMLDALKEDNINIDYDTVSEITCTGGHHYYYYVTYNQGKLLKSHTTLKYNNNVYACDIKFTNSLSYIAPSRISINGERRDYKFINGKSFLNHEIKPLPTELYELFLKNINGENNIEGENENTERVKLLTQVKKNRPNRINKLNFNIKMEIDEIKKHLKYIIGYDNYDRWVYICALCKNLNIKAYDVFNDWAKQSKKYNEAENKKLWNYMKPSNISIGSLKYYVKIDNIEGSDEVLRVSNEKDYIKPNLVINEQYLTTSPQVINNYKTWIKNDDIKSLIFNSCYGSGKTTLIKDILNYEIMSEYDDGEDGFKNRYKKEKAIKSCLYISYRRSLARDFSAKFGFLSYLKNAYNSDFQVVQIDSIEKIYKNDYDLIILDEVESLLLHITTATIKKVDSIFNNLADKIENSKKVLCLDGDINNRSLHFIDYFGQMIYIKNEYKNGGKIFHETKDLTEFYTNIYKKIEENRKICIISQSAKFAKTIEEDIKKKYEKLETKCYYSMMDDIYKKDFDNVNDVFNKCDVLIYSPIIEAGIDFNIKHFNNIFVYCSPMSCTARALSQMLHRIRQISDNNIYIYTEGLTKCQPKELNIYEKLEHYRFINNIPENQELNHDDITKCYNDIEIHNSRVNFIGIFKKLIKNKGNKWIDYNGKKSNIKRKSENEDKKRILEADDITDEEYDTLQRKKKAEDATEEEKYMILKYVYKRILDIDTLNEDILKKYYRCLHIPKNYKFLRSGIYKGIEDDNKKNTEIKKIEIIKKIMNELEYKHDEKIIKKTDIDEKCNIFEQYIKDYKKIINDKTKLRNGGITIRSIFYKIKIMLGEYGIILKPSTENVKKIKVENYKIYDNEILKKMYEKDDKCIFIDELEI